MAAKTPSAGPPKRTRAHASVATAFTVIASASGATLGILPDAANSVGGWLAGAVPHRGPAGSSATAGLDARAMLEAPRKGYLLFGVEPAHDCRDGAQAMAAIDSADFVVSITPFASEATRAQADVLLPVSPFTETSGTFVNCEARWQSFAAVSRAPGNSRPGWKVLRVLGNLLELDGFEQTSSGLRARQRIGERLTLGTTTRQRVAEVVNLRQRELFEDFDPRDRLQVEAFKVLQNLYQDTLERLNSPQLDFELLLPDHWNGKFVMGGGLSQGARVRRHRGPAGRLELQLYRTEPAPAIGAGPVTGGGVSAS